MRIANKSFFAGLLCFVGVALSEPQPIYSVQPVLAKTTGVTCSACGSHMWDWFHELMDEYKGRIFPVAAYTTSYNGYKEGEQDLTGEHATGFLKSLNYTTNPSFIINLEIIREKGGSAWRIEKYLDTTQTVMGMNFEAWTEGNSIKVARVFKADVPVSGDFQLNTFVTEDNIVQYQAGRLNGELKSNHLVVLRRTSTLINKNSKIYGTPLPTSALNGTIYRDTVTIPMGDLWVKENLNIGLVLYHNGVMYNGYTREETWAGEVPKTQFSLSLTGENGSVTPSPARPNYDSSSVVTLEAVPDEGYRFVSWSGDLSGSENPIQIAMESDKSVVANFEPSPVILDPDGNQGSDPDQGNSALSPVEKFSLQVLKADGQGIQFSLSTKGATTLRLSTITGHQQFEKTLSGESETQEISWGRALNKGIYFAHLRSSFGERRSIRFVVP